MLNKLINGIGALSFGLLLTVADPAMAACRYWIVNTKPAHSYYDTVNCINTYSPSSNIFWSGTVDGAPYYIYPEGGNAFDAVEPPIGHYILRVVSHNYQYFPLNTDKYITNQEAHSSNTCYSMYKITEGTYWDTTYNAYKHYADYYVTEKWKWTAGGC